MYKIIILDIARQQIDHFLASYLYSQLSLFVDSWIENVWFIEENYRYIAKKFRDEIYSEIDKIFTPEILPKRVWKNGELSCVVLVGNFRLFIDYTEDKEEEIRYIESIKFSRK